MQRIRLKILLLLALAPAWLSRAYAQELLCQVNVSAPTLGSDQQVYTKMQEAITKYMNFQKWSDLKFEPFERIKARIQILITDRPNNEYFKGTIQVQVIRPVFNSGYETILLNVQDKYFNVNFVPFQDLQFSENQYLDNLTSILNYYAYIIMGVSMDSYELNGGSEFFAKARNVVNLAQNSPETGWRNSDGGGGNKNRYWLADNFVNNSYKTIHTIYYNWHRLGLDAMEKDVAKGRAACIAVMREIQKLNIQNPGLYVVRAFLDAKQQEIVSMFKPAIVTDKRQVLTILEQVDPGNMNQYDAINEEK